MVSIAGRHSLYPFVGWTGGHAAGLDARGAIRRGLRDRFDHGIHGAGGVHEQSRGTIARRPDRAAENGPGNASAGTETFPKLGNGTIAVASCPLYAGRF